MNAALRRALNTSAGYCASQSPPIHLYLTRTPAIAKGSSVCPPLYIGKRIEKRFTPCKHVTNVVCLCRFWRNSRCR